MEKFNNDVGIWNTRRHKLLQLSQALSLRQGLLRGGEDNTMSSFTHGVLVPSLFHHIATAAGSGGSLLSAKQTYIS